MSELAEFLEEMPSTGDTPTEPVLEEVATPAEPEPTPEGEEPQAAAEPTVDEGSPPEPEKPEESGTVPIAALLDEREKRQEAVRKLEAFEAKQQEPEKPVPDVLDDQEGFVAHFDSQLRAQRIETSQEVMRMMHDDYDEAEAKFVDMVKDSPELAQKMGSATLPAKFAYDTVKQAEKLASMENVDEWEATKTAEIEAKVRAEITAEITGKAEEKAALSASLTPSLTSVTAKGGNTPPPVTIEDPLETTFNR